MATLCEVFRASKTVEGTYPTNTKWQDSYCNERYVGVNGSTESCYPQSYAEMFNCLDGTGWAYTGIFVGMGFSILGAGL